MMRGPLFEGPENGEHPQADVESHIEGSFNGWSGSTVFKLRNGQVWQQQGYSHLHRYAYMPRVRIIRSGEGHAMVVEGVDAAVPVKRLQ